MRSFILAALFAITCIPGFTQNTRATESYFVTLRKASTSNNMVVLEIYTQDTRALRVEHFNTETSGLIGTMQVAGSGKPGNGLMARYEYRGDIADSRVKLDVKLPNGATLRVSKTLGTSLEYLNLQFQAAVYHPIDGDPGTGGGGGGICPSGRVTTTVNTVACGRSISVTLCCTPPVVLIWDDNCNISCN